MSTIHKICNVGGIGVINKRVNPKMYLQSLMYKFCAESGVKVNSYKNYRA